VLKTFVDEALRDQVADDGFPGSGVQGDQEVRSVAPRVPGAQRVSLAPPQIGEGLCSLRGASEYGLGIGRLAAFSAVASSDAPKTR
jgi:hypothetical protein